MVRGARHFQTGTPVAIQPDMQTKHPGHLAAVATELSRLAHGRAPFAMTKRVALLMQIVGLALSLGCDDGTEAQRHGVGAACAMTSECTESGQSCLTQFKGGYCGVSDCSNDAGCPAGSACVAHEDGKNYCFLLCTLKPDCNRSRSVDVEANCSSSAVLVEAPKDRKVCVPPSGV